MRGGRKRASFLDQAMQVRPKGVVTPHGLVYSHGTGHGIA